MPRLRVGVVGLGMASAPHAKSLADLVDRVAVVAAYSPTAARRDAFAAATGFPVVADLHAAIEAPNVDAVILLTPPNTHLDLVRRAAAAGKHMLLEKPLETSIDRAQSLVAAAEKAGVKLGVVLQHRFRPVSQALAAAIADGSLGMIVGASAKLGNWRPQSYYDQPGRGTKARDGGGVLLTQAIHPLDLLISLAGLPVEVAGFATTTPVHTMETEDMAMMAVRFGNGALGSISATTCAYPGYPDEIEIIGSKGTARLTGARLALRFNDGTERSIEDEGPGGGAGSDPMAFSHHYHRAVLVDFADSVKHDRAPAITGREALKVHRLIAAMLRASASGRSEAV